MDVNADLRPARLLGSTDPFDTAWMLNLQWPDDDQPRAADMKRMLLTMWTEIRGTVLHAIWRARCDMELRRGEDEEFGHCWVGRLMSGMATMGITIRDG